MKTHPVCFFLGHKVDLSQTPDGVEHCQRCLEARAYAWGDDDMPTTLRDIINRICAPYWRLHFRLFGFCGFRRWLFQRCDCGKPCLICGRHVGDHKNCVPF